ncbi:MAG: protein-L-isoaspartate(D-aspartate) O-methyltransferase [Bryobacteraceae bacterium]|nr:protein-L-isoaspartate(D-aspartate) O-methyltransferase [Bryobacteraceae bacterium]
MLPEEHLEKRGITDPAVLHAIRSVAREEFVPAELRAEAFDDRPLQIGFDATISQPYIVAAMTQLLEVRAENRVLEIGTGSGFQAAVLSCLVAAVYSVEIVPELARSATERLGRLGYANVFVKEADGSLGWPEEAPFDRIILTAAPLQIPDALLGQLAPGGLLVAPEGGPEQQVLILVSKSAAGECSRKTVFPVSFIPMRRT